MMWTLLESAVRAGALAALVAIIIATLRIRDLRLARAAWLTVLGASLLMPLLMELRLVTPPAPVSEWLQTLEFANDAPLDREFTWALLPLLIYCSVASLLMARHVTGLIRLWRLERRSRPFDDSTSTAIHVRVCTEIRSPVTAFSTILVPAEFHRWSSQKQTAVLAHERAHVANHDFYILVLAHLHRSIFWFSPVAWWLPRHLILLGEHLADESASASVGDRAAYAEILLSLVRGDGSRSPPGAVAMVSGNRVTQRVERMLEEHEMSHSNVVRRYGFMTALLPLVGLIAGLQASAQVSPEQVRASSAIVLPKSNPNLPLSQPVYPPPAKLRGEHGTVVLRLQVLADGSVADAQILQSSGYPVLDSSAMYESFRWRLDPGTNNGHPEPMWGRFAVTFKL